MFLARREVTVTFCKRSILEPELFKTVIVTWERKMSSEMGIFADHTKLQIVDKSLFSTGQMHL